ncbi:outer membrane assembly protein AsmA [Orbaceae bacterium ESL0721]|nr:outer membrane assembly protein AsmA [Orbaceae bacterium ESL0721]
MVKKIVITLFILIMIIIVGIVSLVVFVDPNNFKGFISDTVKDKTGYELTIDGDLRWHIWPQISILTDSVKLSDINAAKPILTADNMRLDVELFPLFSKNLAVKNVLVKSAVINITDESKGDTFKNQNRQTATINKASSSSKQKSHWSFTLNKLVMADSTVILQNKRDFINFRDIDISIINSDQENVSIELSGNVNRDQQNLRYNLNANVNLNQFPQSAVIDIKEMKYDYTGVLVPAGELKGGLTGTINYQQSPLSFNSQDIKFTINDTVVTGAVKANLDQIPYIEVELNSDKVDLTPFIQSSRKPTERVTIQQTSPVVSTNTRSSKNELDFLNKFNAKFLFNSKQIIINKIVLENANFEANNRDGIATIKNIDFDLSGGHVKASGIANGKQKVADIRLSTKISDINLASLFSALEIPNDLNGTINATGDLTTNTVVPDAILSALQGQLSLSVTDARLNNINIPNIIQTAVSQYTKDVVTPENQKKYTEVQELLANGNLSNGNLELTSLRARSETLNLDGTGRVGLVNQDLDVELQIQLLGGWNGKSETIAKLQKIIIPLRIYGKFANLNYQVKVDKLIKDLLNDKLQHSLDKLRDRYKVGESESDNDKRNDSKEKAINMLGGFLNKIDKK